jgi:hypothetical protein
MSLLLIGHIIIALTGIVVTTILLFSPSKKKFNLTYLLLAGTIGTGTVLIIMSPSHMLQSCVMGIAYTAFVVTGVVIAKKRLAKEHTL